VLTVRFQKVITEVAAHGQWNEFAAACLLAGIQRDAPMSTAQDLMIDWCKEQQVLLLRMADRLESGTMVIGEKQPDGQLVDNSPENLAQIKSSLASLDRLLSQHST
jgi:hypothetical protein